MAPVWLVAQGRIASGTPQFIMLLAYRIMLLRMLAFQEDQIGRVASVRGWEAARG